MPEPMTQAWLDQVAEDILDPGQRIVDSHHHLWPSGQGMSYDFAALSADIHSGHAVQHSVFVECHSAYRTSGPAHLAPVHVIGGGLSGSEAALG